MCKPPASYIGKYFGSCWQFVVKYYADRGVSLADSPWRSAPFFITIETPKPGDMVMFTAEGVDTHCGICCENGTIEHYTEQSGVVRQDASHFANKEYYTLR